jgi:glutamyl-tRNA synthetase
VPAFAHVPLVLTASGERLAKRTRPEAIADLRARGVSPSAVVGALAVSAGLSAAGGPATPAALVAGFSVAAIDPRAAVVSGL